jgi:hypothetical protein
VAEKDAGLWILAGRGPGRRLFAPGLSRVPFYARAEDLAPESPPDAPFPSREPEMVAAPWSTPPPPPWREIRRFGGIAVYGP